MTVSTSLFPHPVVKRSTLHLSWLPRGFPTDPNKVSLRAAWRDRAQPLVKGHPEATGRWKVPAVRE